MADTLGPPKEFCALNAVKGLKLVHMNVRSLPKKIDQLRILLHNSTIDMLTLSETWLREGLVNNLYDLEGYKLFRCDRLVESQTGGWGVRRKQKKRGGGDWLPTFTINMRHCQCRSTC